MQIVLHLAGSGLANLHVDFRSCRGSQDIQISQGRYSHVQGLLVGFTVLHMSHVFWEICEKTDDLSPGVQKVRFCLKQVQESAHIL